jgi:glutamate-1-semialdehyde 2,1-aminomutase
MNVISLPERMGARDPLSQGGIPEVTEATIVCRFNDAEDVERALREHDVAAVILEPIPHNIGAVLPQPASSSGCASCATRTAPC